MEFSLSVDGRVTWNASGCYMDIEPFSKYFGPYSILFVEI